MAESAEAQIVDASTAPGRATLRARCDFCGRMVWISVVVGRRRKRLPEKRLWVRYGRCRARHGR